MSDIIEILKLAKDAVTSFVTQRHAATEKAWDQVVVALDKLSELTTLHTRAIDEVTAPLLNAETIWRRHRADTACSPTIQTSLKDTARYAAFWRRLRS